MLFFFCQTLKNVYIRQSLTNYFSENDCKIYDITVVFVFIVVVHLSRSNNRSISGEDESQLGNNDPQRCM